VTEVIDDTLNLARVTSLSSENTLSPGSASQMSCMSEELPTSLYAGGEEQDCARRISSQDAVLDATAAVRMRMLSPNEVDGNLELCDIDMEFDANEDEHFSLNASSGASGDGCHDLLLAGMQEEAVISLVDTIPTPTTSGEPLDALEATTMLRQEMWLHEEKEMSTSDTDHLMDDCALSVTLHPALIPTTSSSPLSSLRIEGVADASTVYKVQSPQITSMRPNKRRVPHSASEDDADNEVAPPSRAKRLRSHIAASSVGDNGDAAANFMPSNSRPKWRTDWASLVNTPKGHELSSTRKRRVDSKDDEKLGEAVDGLANHDLDSYRKRQRVLYDKGPM
jgi:hypothetical protein